MVRGCSAATAGEIEKAAFIGSGCAISTASASLMTEALTGCSRSQAAVLFKQFHSMVRGEARVQDFGDNFASLLAFSGVSNYPMRVKCATLAWHAAMAALDGEQDAVSTE